jgi:glycosyltransferase involved in cell wall biosynthesis
MKKKILMLSDHALSTSGVGTQSRFLIEGLIAKGDWTVRQFGAAMKHADYSTVVVNDDFIIKPIDGFGNKEMLRTTLAIEKPDVLFIFTDPRFFIWLFEMEDEIHQICPIVWWHVWDNYPFPKFNDSLYKSTDLINCHSHMTYEMIKDHYPNKTNFIPHSLPTQIYRPLSEEVSKKNRNEIIGPEREDHFVLMWVNRNARRKRPNDLLVAWSMFLEELEKREGHKKATLLMHTDPLDQEGPNLLETAQYLGILDNIVFSNNRVDFEQMNTLYSTCDAVINISYAEGFGLATLEAMNAGKPIIAAKTGGLTRQVIDHRNGTPNGVPLEIDFKSLVGSQGVPYIYEDYVSNENIAKGIMQMYAYGEQGRKALGSKARQYALEEFGFQNTIDMWDATLKENINSWKESYARYDSTEI